MSVTPKTCGPLEFVSVSPWLTKRLKAFTPRPTATRMNIPLEYFKYLLLLVTLPTPRPKRGDSWYARGFLNIVFIIKHFYVFHMGIMKNILKILCFGFSYARCSMF